VSDVVFSRRNAIFPSMGARMNVIETRRWLRASALLDQVLDLPPRQLEPWLASLRAEDTEAADDVQALLLEHQLLSAEGFLDVPPAVDLPLTGVVLGGYTLVSPIDQGGMGSVWLAERSDGRFQGRAAVKLLNVALAGRAGGERFRREGTILARLTHPHIARLIDAGVSAAGQPYLVLEHVEGRHIDRFCDDVRLDVAARIRLFLDVQAAVAHAHATLIVHRDLKPANVLVTDDGRVKLLDFGIAKLLESQGDGVATMLTREGDAALTPKYAAPEQMTGGAITTATDVYALGVLLFELLTGEHPTAATARTPAEFVRAISSTEPMRLSAAVARLAADPEAARERAERRGTTPDRLRRALRGDLETILAKALKTDPGERYASVEAFADDLRRYLTDQPIGARPDALGYRARKFVRRHWTGVTIAAAAVVLLAGLVGYHTVRLAKERDRAQHEAAKASRVSELLTSLLRGADPYRNPDAGREPTVQDLLDFGAERMRRDLNDQPELQAEMLTLIGRTYERMGLQPKALPLLEEALAIGRRTFGGDHVRVAQSLNDLGVLHRTVGHLPQAEALLRESLAMRRRVIGPRSAEVAVTLVELARVLIDSGQDREAETLARESLAIRTELFGDEHRETATSKNELGLQLLRRGEVTEAESLFRQNVATTMHLLGPDHPNTAAAKGNLGLVLAAKGDLAGAEALAREALAVNLRAVGPDHLDSINSLSSVGAAVELQGRLEEAQTIFEECVRRARARVPEEHPRLLGYMVNLARVRIARGLSAGTEPSLRAVLRIRERVYPGDRWRIAQAQSLLGAALLADHRYAEAEPLMIAADGVLQPIVGPQGRERAANQARLAELHRRWSPQAAARR
jgi:tetratricopeptide (TPR) repeat protein